MGLARYSKRPFAVLDQKRSSRAVTEAEHEPRALVGVVEEVRLPAGADEQHVLQLGFRDEHVARQAQRDGRTARDVVVLDGVRVRRADAMRDPRRGLPDRVVLPHRSEVHDDVDRLGIDVDIGEE